MIIKKGFTTNQLKIIALVFMVLDHLFYFFDFTGVIPVAFSMIGRLSAPIFLFCLIEGFSHTHNKRMYYLKIVLIASLMGLIQFMLITFNIIRPDGFYPRNMIFSNFVLLIIIFQGIELCEKHQWIKGITLVTLPFIWPFVATILSNLNNNVISVIITLLHYTVLPISTIIQDGGLSFIFIGTAMYIFKDNKTFELFIFAALSFLFYFIIPYCLIPNCTLNAMFTQYYEWFSLFSVIILLNYNGFRGKGSKYFFYVFYPTHVYILFIMSWILMINMN